MKKGFTLIELLVVLVIIAILIALLVPVLLGVQEKGKATQDASNLRQLGLGILANANDNDGVLLDTNTANLTWSAQVFAKVNNSYRVIVSPFDRRAIISTTSSPLSYGMNTNVILAPDASKFTNAGSLVLLAPAPDNAAKLLFSGTLNAPPSISSASLSVSNLRGTHSSRKRINALFGDYHVETLLWSNYVGNASTGTSVGRWQP